MNYYDLMDLFEYEVLTPEDNTDCFWYTTEDGGIHYNTPDGVDKNPDNWIGGGYSSDVMKDVTKKADHLICTLDNGCGGEFQAFFKLSMEIDPEEFD